MDLKNPDKAREYLRFATKGRITDSDMGIQVSGGRIKTTTNKRVTVNHVAMAETITKFINMTPGMSPVSRKIMTMKIVNPGMTNAQIGIVLALRNHEIEAYEADGKAKVKDFMRVSEVSDVVSVFEKNKGALNKEQRFVEKCIHFDSPLIRA